MGYEIALNHHERWDGGGYPKGKSGEEIPFSARLMNIADQYDALRSKRPYKPAFSHERSVEIITCGDGRTEPGHFDPQVLAAFGRCVERWREIYDTNAD
jgi:putative two-component system response regulator